MLLLIHIPHCWLSSCLLSSIYPPVDCHHVFLSSTYSNGFSHVPGHPQLMVFFTHLVVITDASAWTPTYHLILQWFWPFTSAYHPLVLRSPHDSGHPHTILLAVVKTLASTYHTVGFTVLMPLIVHLTLAYLASLLALAATLSLFISSNGGLRGARVGAEEFSLVHGAKPAPHRRPPTIIILLFVIFALFSFLSVVIISCHAHRARSPISLVLN